jgi:methylmalonyl-CoA/ethylmalonyl-CoA epimerase
MSTKTTAIDVQGIGQIYVTAHDLERATTFYRDVLGLQFLFEASNMAFFQCGDVRVMLGVPEKPEFDHPASIIYYRVGDIQQAHRALLERGAHFEREPIVAHRTDAYELWLAFLRDSEENLLALMSEVPIG